MFLTPLVFVAALVLEILGSYMSVIGLSSKSSIVLIILAIALDFSKIVIASVVYKNWKDLNFMFKSFLVPATVFLMVITSYGAYAYLLQEFGKTTSNQEQITYKLSFLEAENQKLTARKKEIDAQISEVSPVFVTQKKRLTEMFSKELEYVNDRTIELDKEIPAVRASLMSDSLQSGTLSSLSKAWGTTPDQAAKFLALMMVLVIDPLAIVMLMVGNFLDIKRKKDAEIEEIRKEQKQLDKEKREYELRKMKISGNNHETEINKKIEEVKIEPEVEKTLAKAEMLETIETKKIEEMQILVTKEMVQEKRNDKIKAIKKEIKQKNSWETSAPALLVSAKETKKQDEELDKVVSMVNKQVISKVVTEVNEDPFHADNSIEDMLNNLDDLDNKRVLINSSEK
jgi:hypothetical protein